MRTPFGSSDRRASLAEIAIDYFFKIARWATHRQPLSSPCLRYRFHLLFAYQIVSSTGTYTATDNTGILQGTVIDATHP